MIKDFCCKELIDTQHIITFYKCAYTERSLATLCTYSYNNNLVLFSWVNIQRYHGVITRLLITTEKTKIPDEEA